MRAILLASAASLLAGPAFAGCSGAFDGIWTYTAQVGDQCTAISFWSDAANGQVEIATWTNLSNSCDVGSGTILQAEYGNQSSNNLTATTVDKRSCRLEFGEANVLIDQYNSWQPASPEAILYREEASVQWCFSESDHELGQCLVLDFREDWT